MSPRSPLTTTVTAPGLDLGLTLTALRMGVADPCFSAGRDGTWMWAARTPDGPVTLRATPRPRGIRLEGWGPGADWAAGRAASLVGADDEGLTTPLPDPVVADLVVRFLGLRMAASHQVAEAAISGVCRRGVSAFEAGRSWALMTERWGDDAPGPGGLRLPPSAARLADAAPYDLHVMGLEQARAAEVRRVASHASRLQGDGADSTETLIDRLASLPGVGADVVAHTRSVALGDADAIPIVDGHVIAGLVRLLGGEAEGDLTAGLARLAPQRGRVVRVIEAASALRP